MFTLNDLKHFVESNPNLVMRKQSVVYPNLSVLKYKNRCFYDGIWNQYIENCRGLVVDENWDIVNYPFAKIFNYGIEKNAPVIGDDEIVTAIRKVNGFMAAASMYNNELLVSTTGSLDSDYAKLAKELIQQSFDLIRDYPGLSKDHTYIFEICHVSDPHIIPEKEGVYLLGIRENELNSEIIIPDPFHANCDYTEATYLPEKIVDTFANMKKLVKTVKHEGFVVYAENGRTTKIKSPYYLFNKFLARCKNKQKLFDNLQKRTNPEEFYGVIDKINKNREEFFLLGEQERLEFIRDIFEGVY